MAESFLPCISDGTPPPAMTWYKTEETGGQPALLPLVGEQTQNFPHEEIVHGYRAQRRRVVKFGSRCNMLLLVHFNYRANSSHRDPGPAPISSWSE